MEDDSKFSEHYGREREEGRSVFQRNSDIHPLTYNT
jgi:hypothetical protein